MTFVDCGERKTVTKRQYPERPECLHGPMAVKSADRWRCRGDARERGRRQDARRLTEPKRRAWQRDRYMRNVTKAREARIGAREAVLSTPERLLAHLGVVTQPIPLTEPHEANAMGSRITGAHFLA